jgi:CBS domain-containing protein
MGDAKRVKEKVKEIMTPIEEYNKVDIDGHLCDVLDILKKNMEEVKAHPRGPFHKTFFVTDASKKIVGHVSMYGLVRGLVPEAAKKPELSRAYYSLFSGRAQKVSEQIGEFQEEFKWISSTFPDLVKQEAHKKIRDIMTPVHPILKEEDNINRAIYIMFKEHVRQPLVVRDGEIVGVVNLYTIFNELLEMIGSECPLPW